MPGGEAADKMAAQIDVDQICAKVCQIFKIPKLNAFQEQCAKAYVEKKDVLVCSKTGSGKSLMYQLTFVAGNWDKFSGLHSGVHDVHDDVQNHVHNALDCRFVVVVVPLLSIMQEHVKKLTSVGFSATYIGKDHAEDARMFTGSFDFVYASPEDLVGNRKWRNEIKKNKDKIACFVIDEAHTMINWGESVGNDAPFREWFGHIGELRSLCVGCPVFAFTATASSAKRKKIMMRLCMTKKAVVLVDSPDRENVKLSLKHVKATEDIDFTFQHIIDTMGPSMPRHVIFCKTVKDCSRVYNGLKDHDKQECVEMFHSKSLGYIKKAIIEDMEQPHGAVRVLVCTNAAGMGVNFAALHSVVNFGPPQDLDAFVQQIGRAGRDGVQSHHILIFNGRQLNKCDKEMKAYVKNNDTCRRQLLLESYVKDVGAASENVKHLCCDVCSKTCDCGLDNCAVKFENFFQETCDEAEPEEPMRTASPAEKFALEELLSNFKDTGSCDGAIVGNDVLQGFTSEVIKEIVGLCDVLDDAEDIFTKTSVMSWQQAVHVADIFAALFSDSFFLDSDADDDEDSDDDDLPTDF